MALTPEQVQELKKQLSEQIQNLPEDQKAQAQEQIDSMSPEALEGMLRQQQAQMGSGIGQGSQQPQKGIFRMLVDGDIPAKKVDENKECVAVVSKRAISKGHVLVIPKKSVSDSKLLPSSAFTLAKKIARKFATKFKASGAEIQTEAAFGEVIVNVFPVYGKPVSVDSERYDASEEEMQEVYEKLRIIVRPKKEVIRTRARKESEALKLRRRVP